MLLLLNGYHGNKKYHSRISDVSNISSIKFHVLYRPTDRNIRPWLLLNCAFIIADVTIIYCFSGFAKLLKKQHFRFLSFFLVKLPKSHFLKLNISRTAWPILMILVSFCRILNSLSDKINLFWHCSSPLKTLSHKFCKI